MIHGRNQNGNKYLNRMKMKIQHIKTCGIENPDINPYIIPFNEERTVFSTNGGRKTGYSHIKKLIWTYTLHCIQNLIQNGSKT